MRTVKKNILFVYGLTFSMIGFCLFLFYIALEMKYLSYDFSSLFEWRYINILPVSFLYLMAFVVVSGRNNIVSNHIAIPSILFLLAFGFFIYIGTFDHYLRVLSNAKFIYNESISTGYNYISIALASWIAGYVLSQNLRVNTSVLGTTLVWDRRRLYVMNLFWGAIGLTAFALFFAFYVKGVPLLQGVSPNVSDELRDLLAGKGHNISLIAVNVTTMALLFSGVYLVNFRKKFAMILVFLSALACFLFWGARIHVVFPFMVILILLSRKKAYGLPTVAIILLIMVLLATTYGMVRNRNFFNRNTLLAQSITEIHISPEFRDTLGVISHLDELQAAYRRSDYLKGICLTALPAVLWRVIGIDKDRLFSKEAGPSWIIADVTRGYNWTGLRPGIIGQTLMAFGTYGVILVFFLVGVLFSQLDRFSRTITIPSVTITYVYLITILFSYLIIAMIDSVFLRFWYFTYGFLVTTLIASKRVYLYE